MTDGKMHNDPCADGDGDCQKAASLVDFYIDNLLESSDKQFINQHIADCPECKHGFDFELSFHDRVRKLTPLPLPDVVRSNIMLALGFPGISDPIKGSFSTLGSVHDIDNNSISSGFGIPQGQIPKGEIPSTEKFSPGSDSSSSNDEGTD